MARNSSRVNGDWPTPTGDDFTWDHVAIEVLMDIRSELRLIRQLTQCSRIPRALDAVLRIDRRLAKRVKLP